MSPVIYHIGHTDRGRHDRIGSCIIVQTVTYWRHTRSARSVYLLLYCSAALMLCCSLLFGCSAVYEMIKSRRTRCRRGCTRSNAVRLLHSRLDV